MGTGFLEANGLAHRLDDGRELFDDVSFRVSTGQVVALVGANGAGKTTLLRMLSGDITPRRGGISVQGGLGVMPQFIGSVRDERTVRDLLLAVAAAPLRAAAVELDAAELAMMETDDEPTQLRYANALHAWGETGGYDAEVLWDTVTVAALGVPFERAQFREVRTLSGGEQKRLVLEALLLGREQVLLLDEPDNYLDMPGKRWLEGRLRESGKAVLVVSHDRELLASAATHVVTLEATRPGFTAAGSSPGTTRGRRAGTGWRSCGGGGTRSTRSSRNWYARCSNRRRTTTGWRRGTGRPRPGCVSSRRPARRRCRRVRSGCGRGFVAGGPGCGRSRAPTSS